MTDRFLTLRLVARAHPQPIAGWLRDEHGGEHYFSGWLALLTLLEQARLMQDSDSGDSPAEVSMMRNGRGQQSSRTGRRASP
jgi:hypothetical protein